MANHPRPFGNTTFFSSAAATVQHGRYRYYENDNAPAFLQDERQQRTRSAYNCQLIVATVWSQGRIGEVTPTGTTYLVFEYTDHRHNPSDFHFNKEVKFYFTDQSGHSWRLTMNKDIDGHYINAVATGTSLSYLHSAYALPKKPEGTIQDLIDEGTSIGPYPGEQQGPVNL
ncbi:MAG: hypothetical protein IT585_04700 [candidate division Zixibacteria bacterium]|nr:hypothetical protein [candidate division Zixibacteria bacterium]